MILASANGVKSTLDANKAVKQRLGHTDHQHAPPIISQRAAWMSFEVSAEVKLACSLTHGAWCRSHARTSLRRTVADG